MAAFTLLPVVVLVGCGGDGGGSAASSGTTAVAAGSADAASLRECLAERGIEVPDAPPGGQGPSGSAPSGGVSQPPGGPSAEQRELPEGMTQEDFREAMEACGGGRQADMPGLSEIQAYGSCLEDNGVTVEGGDDGPPQIDRDDPDFAAADETCAALRPAPPATSTTVAAP